MDVWQIFKNFDLLTIAVFYVVVVVVTELIKLLIKKKSVKILEGGLALIVVWIVASGVYVLLFALKIPMLKEKTLDASIVQLIVLTFILNVLYKGTTWGYNWFKKRSS